MGWVREKYTREYFLKRDASGRALPYGASGVEAWEQGDIYGPAKALLDQVELKGAMILDIGCGRGEALRYCLKNGAAKVCGLDFSVAALELASISVKDFESSRSELICEDVHEYVQRMQRIYTHIFMLDAIEHIPRREVEAILPHLYASLEPGGSLIVHTPFYPEDDDVLVTGGKAVCRDSSDDFEQTKGMHINRYTRRGLGQQFSRYGFVRWTPYIFFHPVGRFPVFALRGFGGALLAKRLGYKIK